jgi:hypothetical protein
VAPWRGGFSGGCFVVFEGTDNRLFIRFCDVALRFLVARVAPRAVWRIRLGNNGSGRGLVVSWYEKSSTQASASSSFTGIIIRRRLAELGLALALEYTLSIFWNAGRWLSQCAEAERSPGPSTNLYHSDWDDVVHMSKVVPKARSASAMHARYVFCWPPPPYLCPAINSLPLSAIRGILRSEE